MKTPKKARSTRRPAASRRRPQFDAAEVEAVPSERESSRTACSVDTSLAPPAALFWRRHNALLKAWDRVGVFDPLYPRPFLAPRSRRFKWGGAAAYFGDRRKKYLDVLVPEEPFRNLFAAIFVGHRFKTVRPATLNRHPAIRFGISQRLEGILRGAAEHEPQSDERAQRWQEEAHAILEEHDQWRQEVPELPRPIPDGSDDDLLLRAFGAFLILADRKHCSLEEFISDGSSMRPGMFRKMVDAAGICFPARKPNAVKQRLRRAGGHARAIARADAHITAFYPELRPWRMSFGLRPRGGVHRPTGWDRRLLPEMPETPTA